MPRPPPTSENQAALSRADPYTVRIRANNSEGDTGLLRHSVHPAFMHASRSGARVLDLALTKRWLALTTDGQFELRERDTGGVVMRESARAENALGLSPDKRLLAVGPARAVLDLSTRTWVARLAGIDDELVFSRDGATLFESGVSSSTRGRAIDTTRAFVDRAEELGKAPVEPGSDALRILSDPDLFDARWTVATSPDGRWFVLGTHGGDVGLRRVSDQGFVALLQEAGTGRTCWRAVFSPTGDRIAFGSGSDVRVVTTADQRAVATLRGHEALVVGIAFDEQAHVIATTSLDGTLRTWDAADGTPRAVLRLAASARAVTTSPDGTQLVVACSDGRILIFDGMPTTAGAKPSRVIDAHTGDASAVAFDRSGSLFASGGADGVVHVYDASNFKLLYRLTGAPNVRDLSFGRNGSLLAAARFAERGTTWDLSAIEHACGELGIGW